MAEPIENTQPLDLRFLDTLPDLLVNRDEDEPEQ